MRIDEVFRASELMEEVKAGTVRLQTHPVFPLIIACYTKEAVVQRKWNVVTRNCRGLIWNHETMEVVARPFPKFFNLGEPLAREDYEAQVEVYDKLDGSLGIGYVYEGKTYVATKGSFSSDQALEGSKILHETYPDWIPPEGVTPLWEIIYPENRIVLDYGGARHLALLEGIDITTGKTHEPAYEDQSIFASWPGLSLSATNYTTLAEAVGSIPRANAEGWVVRYIDTDDRVKIKQDDYLAKHKLVFNLSQKTIWESLRDCRFNDYKAGMPDEFHDWMDLEASKYWQKFDDYMSVVYECTHDPDLSYLIECLDQGDPYARLMIADMIKDVPGWLEKTIWCLIDGISYHRLIFKQFEPKGQTKVAKP